MRRDKRIELALTKDRKKQIRMDEQMIRNTINEQIVFYGAGENARENLKRWKENGLVPLCFCDKKLEMHGTTLDTLDGEAFPILSLLEVTQKYPNYVLYLTQKESSLADTTEFLFGLGIPKERIRYCDGFLEPRYCRDYLLSNFVNIESDRDGRTYCTSCCNMYWRQARFLTTGDFSKDYKRILAYNDHLKALLKEGYYNRCYGCSACVKVPDTGYPTSDVKYAIDLSTGCIEDGDICNQRCIYCGYPHIHREKHKLIADTLTNGKRYDVFEILKYIEENIDPKDVSLTYCAAEIGAQNKHNTKILDIWQRNNWRGNIPSNSTVFLPGIAALLEKNLISLMTSVDCGCRETYIKIKNADFFERVRNNLQRYADTKGGILRIKYIVLPGVNDNTQEIDLFLDLVADLSSRHPNVVIPVSRDRALSRKDMTENELAAIKYLITQAKERSLRYHMAMFSVSQKDVEMINPDVKVPWLS